MPLPSGRTSMLEAVHQLGWLPNPKERVRARRTAVDRVRVFQPQPDPGTVHQLVISILAYFCHEMNHMVRPFCRESSPLAELRPGQNAENPLWCVAAMLDLLVLCWKPSVQHDCAEK